MIKRSEEEFPALEIKGIKRERLPARAVWNFLRKKPLASAAAGFLIFLVAVAVLADMVAPYDPIKQFYRDSLSPPSRQYLFGTDNFGRDLYSRVIHGSRISLSVGFLSVTVGLAIGTMLGILSGFVGGKTDLAIQRVMDAILAIPFLISAMVIVAVLGAALQNVIIAIAFIQTPRANRVVRGAVMAARENQYVEAATAIGASKLRIMARHILPNVFAPIAIIASVDLGSAIITEASLSFLGLGVRPPNPSWGGILSLEGRPFIEAAPWIAIFPGVAISLTVLAFNIFGDGLRDVLDPRLRT